MRFQGKVAVVTGAAAGIGRCVSEMLVAEGAQVCAVDIADIPYENAAVQPYRLDVSDSEAARAFFEFMTEKYGRIDILVNNAGITRDAMTYKMADEQWDLVMNVNLKGVFNLTRQIGPFMERQGSGAIVNISSVVAEFGNIGQANYAATKSAIYGLTKTWAKEFARKGAAVRVNAVSPGYTLTDILSTVPQDLLNKFATQTMLGRLAYPEEIAKAIVFLASDDASYITGHNLSVNGGMRL
ncbi:MAG: SDR family oxidoreductase [Clostridiales bacterium]|jgi:3-oxoacyl-[acyl-carrier protein] reductase|nr:SDR family oxidoreductase [Clostridiales bacterium]